MKNYKNPINKRNNKDYKVGFIGCGEIASVHASCLEKLGIKITGCYDMVKSAGEIFANRFNCKEYDNASELLYSGIDALYICTRHDSHLNYIKLAAPKIKDIFCEKPLAINYDQALEAADTLRKEGVNFTIGFNHRFTPGIQSLKRKLEEKTSRLYSIDIDFVTAPFLAGWPAEEKVGGGVLVCLGSHVFDLLGFLTASPVEEMKLIISHLRLSEKYLEDSMSVVLKTEEGTLVSITAHDLGNEEYSVEKANLNTVKVFTADRVYFARGLKDLKIYSQGLIQNEEYSSDFKHCWGYYDINRHFINSLGGKRDADLPGIDEALRAAELVERAKKEAVKR